MSWRSSVPTFRDDRKLGRIPGLLAKPLGLLRSWNLYVNPRDEIIVIAGKDKGKRGKVLRVLADDRLVVGGINLVKRHTKPNPMSGVQGGIVEKEAPLHISRLMLVDPQTEERTRIRRKRLEDGTWIRVAVKSGEQIPESR